MADQIQQVPTPEEIKRMSREELGLLGMMSGDAVIAPVGSALYKQNAPAKPGKKQGLQSLGHGILYDPNTGESITNEAYEAAMKRDRDHREKLAQMRLDATASARDTKQDVIPESTQRSVAEFEYQANEGARLADALEALPATKEKWLDMPSEIARKAGMGGLATILAGGTDEERKLRASISSYVAAIRHQRYGAALTETEKAEWSREDPLASGIGAAEGAERLRNLAGQSTQQAEGLRGGRQSPGATSTQDPQSQVPQSNAAEVWELDENGNPVRVR